MELAILRDEERRMNLIMFLFTLVIPLVAFLRMCCCLTGEG